MDVNVLNALLNGATIVTFVAYFWWQNQKGNIITRRENSGMLDLKDQIIATKDETIRTLLAENEELREVGGLIKDFIESVKQELARRGGS